MLVGIVEFLGWFGAVTVLAGYILFSTGKLPNGLVYQLFNLVGGLAVAVNVAAHHAIPSTIVNGIWAVVAVVVLVRMGRARRAARRAEPTDGLRRDVAGDDGGGAPVLHTEPPATTGVLPVMGPAVRDHEADAASVADAAPGLQADPGHDPVPATGPAPMTETVPIITATIALALVAAAQEQAGRSDEAAQRAARTDSAR